MGPVPPMLIPEDIGIKTGYYQRRNPHAIQVSFSAHHQGSPRLFPQIYKPESLTKVLSCARDLDSSKSASTYTQRFNELLTSCTSSVLLHGQPLAIESVILGTFENSALGAGKSSLERRAHGW
jgi:hypothetical protein